MPVVSSLLSTGDDIAIFEVFSAGFSYCLQDFCYVCIHHAVNNHSFMVCQNGCMSAFTAQGCIQVSRSSATKQSSASHTYLMVRGAHAVAGGG